MSDVTWQVKLGDVREQLAALPAQSVQCCVTSPPYWNLRDYGTATWDGGDPACDHAPRAQVDGSKASTNGGQLRDRPSMFCKCGARRIDSQIGLEPTPDAYVAGLVAVFREVRRVLRDDGTVWLNLGDSYAGGGGFSPNAPSNLAGSKQATQGGAKSGGIRPQGEIKAKDLVGIPWAVAFALRNDGWYLRSDIIWCLSGGARVYARTQKGDMPIMVKDLVRLNPATVKLWNGQKWTQVLGWNRSVESRDTALEIELRNGERIGCTPGHQWPTQRGNVRADELQIGDVVATTHLPSPEQPTMPDSIPDWMGFFVGLYLAEGSRSGDTIQIASHAKEDARFFRLQRIAESLGGTCRAHLTGASGNSMTINLNGKMIGAVIDTYIAGATSADKHLTNACWQRENAFLESVLSGYLDGDAHYDEANDRWRLGFTRNEALAADLRTLAARLGLPIRIKACWVEGFGDRWPAYRGDIRLTPSAHHNAREGGEIVAIRPSRARQFWDIGVEDEPHLFALASGVLTHNSKPNPMPESVTDRPTKAHEYLFLLAKSPQYFYDAEAIREPLAVATVNDSRGLGRIPQAYDATGRRGAAPTASQGKLGAPESGRNKRSVWTIATQPYPEAHFATYPEALIEPCILAGTSARGQCPQCGAPWGRVVERSGGLDTSRPHCPKQAQGESFGVYSGIDTSTLARPGWRNDPARATVTTGWQPSCTCEAGEPVPQLVLDPFTGSGTTGAVAVGNGRSFVGCELNPAYLELARRRIGSVAPLLARELCA